jgi:hypothetical protein
MATAFFSDKRRRRYNNHGCNSVLCRFVRSGKTELTRGKKTERLFSLVSTMLRNSRLGIDHLGRIFLHQLSSHLESHLNCYFF